MISADCDPDDAEYGEASDQEDYHEFCLECGRDFGGAGLCPGCRRRDLYCALADEY